MDNRTFITQSRFISSIVLSVWMRTYNYNLPRVFDARVGIAVASLFLPVVYLLKTINRR